MPRELRIEAADSTTVGIQSPNVVVAIRSDTERDIAKEHDAEDLILWVARVMGWSVSVNKQGGDSEADALAGGA